MTAILLTTLNAKWIHASFGLRYLRSNLGSLRPQSKIVEFDIHVRATDAAERLLAESPKIIGLGVYIWNAPQSLELVAVLKRVAPEVVIVIGGPEVSHESEGQAITELADYTVCGEADLAFAQLCNEILAGARPMPRLITAALPHMAQVAWPYDEYDEIDLRHRVVYVEASRGCPFTCEFCLSALDVPVRQTDLSRFLAQMDRLLERGLLRFKFVDRTFNLSVPTSSAILQFFLDRLRPGLFLHFEMIPDRLPSALRELLAQFPPACVQLEVGIQTFDPDTSARISRQQDVAKIEDNLRWLKANTGVYVHADLIAGLPGEGLHTFGAGFDRLWALHPDEIQLGILKRLRGTPIVRHDREFGMVYSPQAPYEVLQTSVMSFAELQRVGRAARCLDLVANSQRFPAATKLLMYGGSAFANLLAFADDLLTRLGRTHAIALHRLAQTLFEHLTVQRGLPPDHVGNTLATDYAASAADDWPELLRPYMPAARSSHRRRHLDTRQARRRDGDSASAS